MSTHTDTIAAIATAPGESGIAIIRISGPGSFGVAGSIFFCTGKPLSGRRANTFVHGFVKSGGKIIDEAIALIMRAPRSYTREDTVELQCHGGFVSARRVLCAALRAGARAAEPGEFTKRAFLNGRIDLLQAEAILDLICAQSSRSADAALEQLGGGLSRCLNDIYDKTMKVSSNLEAILDFGEDDTLIPSIPRETARLRKVSGQINLLLETWNEGHLLREGALAVISGLPNTGKSTLLNALLGLGRAIVSPIPGTTRDTLEETLLLEGFPIRLVDTAGLRTAECVVEQEGVRRAFSLIERADVHLYVVECASGIRPEDVETLKKIDPARAIIIANKTDLGDSIKGKRFGKFRVIKTQLNVNKGVKEIKAAIILILGLKRSGQWHASISERHKSILEKSKFDIDEAIKILNLSKDKNMDIASSHLRFALEFLGQITGKTYHEELLNSIFSKFCIGK